MRVQRIPTTVMDTPPDVTVITTSVSKKEVTKRSITFTRKKQKLMPCIK
jgi:hypothetical protein